MTTKQLKATLIMLGWKDFSKYGFDLTKDKDLIDINENELLYYYDTPSFPVHVTEEQLLQIARGELSCKTLSQYLIHGDDS